MYWRDPARIFQFKITLKNISPLIWRRLQVPEAYSFWELHVALQNAMGWQDYHLHRFEVLSLLSGLKTTIGIPYEGSKWHKSILPAWQEKIASYFLPDNRGARYLYDYLGDNWDHSITLEQILDREDGTSYPLCLDGMRACPPEDCGGVEGYYRLLESGKKFEPEQFDSRKIHFDNPDHRLDLAFNK
jgi:hypothetical protein